MPFNYIYIKFIFQKKRDTAVREAVQQRRLDPSDSKAVKAFRLSISPVKAHTVQSPPHSDDDVGQVQAKQRRAEDPVKVHQQAILNKEEKTKTRFKELDVKRRLVGSERTKEGIGGQTVARGGVGSGIRRLVDSESTARGNGGQTVARRRR